MKEPGPETTSLLVADRAVTYITFARYEWRPNLHVQLNMDNVTNERYIVRANILAFAPASDRRRIKLTLGHPF